MRLVAPVVLLLVLVAPASQAMAQAHVDPDSPAGVEYQVPLDRARDAAGGGGQTGGQAPTTGGNAETGSATPLFGVGIKPAKSNGGKATGSSGKPAAADDPADPPKANATAASNRVVAGETGSSIPVTVAIAAALVLLGAGGGLLLRRTLGKADA